MFESPEDRERERAVLAELAEAGSVDFEQQEPGSTFDAWFINRRGQHRVAIVEVKCRQNSARLYRTLTIDADKVNAIRRLALQFNVIPILVATWTDRSEPWWVRLTPPYRTSTQTRDREGEQPDVVYHIPISEFLPAVRVAEVL